MLNENEFMLHAFCMGIYITFVYDILRILRRVFPHGGFFVSLEDICFWIYCAVKVFLLMYHESNGTLRWFAVFGAIAGMVLYMKLASPFFVKYVSLLLQKIVGIIGKIIRFLLRPVRYLLRRMRERAVRAARRRAVKRQKNRELRRGILKKKLTFLRKVLKMDL
ncbi:MAG: spore cortex biosynthesis protein YabQ [Acetatifactor sp.]|nr:spore cortex biosynthesis protein YabQ [Acetatifactor sp.]MDE7113568.1 spore cortex biosynthesis protein YabQ [Acetatifactor sp.]